METRMAEDREMIDRLNTAGSKLAAKLAALLDRVAQLDDEVAADAKADAEALRPAVEFLEQLGADASTPVPDVDPVPSEPDPQV
jgi:hypothetical protein